MIAKNKMVTVTEIIEATASILKERNYSNSALADYKLIWNEFQNYAEAKGCVQFSPKLTESYLIEVRNIDRSGNVTFWERQIIRSVQVLTDYYQYGVIFRRQRAREYNYPPQFKNVFEAYIEYRIKLGSKYSATQTTKLYLEEFGEFLNQNDVRSFDSITPLDITNFSRHLIEIKRCSIPNVLSAVRGLFTFAAGRYHSKNLAHVVPKCTGYKTPPLPSVYTPEEVENILNVVDRSNPLGKRNYAILLLAARLGMRTGDICALKFNNLNWEENRIEFIQEKTGNPLSLPLLNEIGEAIIDYIKYGRPKSELDNIFMLHKAPYTALTGKSLSYLVKKYTLAAGINLTHERKSGLHTMRHSLASALLEKDTPLPVISEILGHAETESTNSYLRIAISKLKECALEVPQL